MKSLINRAVLICLAVLVIAGASYSQTQINGAASGNWSSTGSWSPATVPNNSGPNTYNVTLLSSPAVNITLDISPTIDTLTLDSGSILSTNAGTTLTTTGVTNGGDIEFYNGNTLTVNGSMTTSNYFDLDKGSKLVVTGNLTNSNDFYTDIENDNSAANTITVSGTFTNSGTTYIGYYNDTSDVMNVGTLSNTGFLDVDTGATLNLTGQPNGVTDVVSGSELDVYGTFKAGTANGLAKLNSVEGTLVIGNGQTFTDTPGSGTLTNSNVLDLEEGSNVTVSGNLTNSGTLETNIRNQESSGHPNTLTVTGTLTNNIGATTYIGYYNDTTDVMNVGTLVNNGNLDIYAGATLNLTNQPNGVTDVVGGSELDVYGTLKAGSANGLAKLNSVEGTLVIGNGQTLADTPGSGTLTNSGTLDLEEGSNVTVSGNLTNSGTLETNIRNQGSGKTNTLTVTGTFTNSSVATTRVGYYNDTTDVMNVATLVNNGFLGIYAGATLNLTSQPNGVTDVVGGSELDVYGTLKAGTANGLAKLGSVEGTLVIGNGQTFTDTPGSGTLTNSGTLDLELDSNVTVSGNLTNSGTIYTNVRNSASGTTNTLTVTGAFTNTGTTHIGYYGDTNDVMNVATLSNSGTLYIDTGATFNLTSQPSGVTDVGAGSELDVYGTLKAGTANGLAKLGSIEGTLYIANGQTLTDTPGTGTLTNSGTFDLEENSNVTVSGNLTNSGGLYTDVRNQTNGGKNTLTITGAFTNNSGATTNIGYFGDTTDVMNVATLVNNGTLQIGSGATLNLTNQPNGLTDVVAGSDLYIFGTFKAGANNALANLGSVEGSLVLENGQTTTVTPGTGTLTISSVGQVDLELGSTLTVDGNLTNSGHLYTNVQNREGGTNNITVTGTFDNASGATADLGYFGDSTAVMTVGTLNNAGFLSVGNTDTLVISKAGTLTNTGTLNVGDSTGGATLEITGNTTLTGTNGKVVLSNFAGNVIEGAASTDVLTIAKGQTVEGSGNIGNNSMGLNNQGIIDADQPVPLIIQIPSGSTNSNSGTLEATAGATLQLDAGTYTQTSAGNILATETGNALSTVNLESGVTINGGKLTITGTTATINLVGTSPTLTLNGVTISGSGKLVLPDGSSTTLLGTNSNTSTIDLNSTGDQTKLVVGAASVTLNGTGKIILATNGDDVITGAASTDVLHSANTIEGPGNIGNGDMGLVNSGLIETVAHQTGQTEIDASSAGFTNQGTVEAVASTTLYIDNASNQFTNFNSSTDTLTGGVFVVDGILKFDDANITTDAANITLSGAAAKIENATGGNAITNLNTIAAGGIFDIITQSFTTTGNFTNNGTLDVGTGAKFIVNSADSLTNFSGSTLTGGAYNVTGTLEFAGANIVNNDASITLTGTKALIENSTNSANALAGFANNEAGATFALATAAKFTTAGNFTNSGTLNVGTGSLFAVGASGADQLTNFSSATSTLTGGTYIVTGTGQIQFNNGGGSASIVTNAANITLSTAGSTASFIDQTGANMLANFATNASTGSFTLASNRSFTTAGAFSNAGSILINKGSTFTVGASGAYTNSAGSTTVNGTLTVGSSGAVDITGGTLFGDAGTINGNVSVTGSSLVDPGDGIGGIGDIKVADNYTQASSASLDIDLGGTAANTLYDVLDITGAASLNGTLNVDLVNGYTPKVNASFTILNFGSDTGSSQFSTVNLPTVAGDHWTVTYNAKDLVIKLVAGPGPNVVVDDLTSASSTSAATSTAIATAARRVSGISPGVESASNKQEPVAILSRVTCFAARLIGSGSCDKASTATAPHGGELHAASSVFSAGYSTPHNNIAAHNNVMVATRSISVARGGASYKTSASATAMARLYVCAYLPSAVGHTIGCN
jgi:fibronectin-binding autotransporter adhesin